MRFRFFAIPVAGSEEAEEALNACLAGHRIVSVDREFVSDGWNSFWAVCVTIQEEECE